MIEDGCCSQFSKQVVNVPYHVEKDIYVMPGPRKETQELYRLNTTVVVFGSSLGVLVELPNYHLLRISPSLLSVQL